MTTVTGTPDAAAGRNRVSERALRRVASAITAEAMGVSPRDVTVVLADDKGLLGVSASTPIRVRPLGSRQSPTATVLHRATSAQATIRERMLELTGSEVGRVSIRLTSTTTGSTTTGSSREALA